MAENTSMTTTMSESAIAPLQLDPNEINFYKREGYLYLPGMIDRETADRAKEETLDILERVKMISDRSARGKEGQTQKLIQSGQYFEGSTLDGMINSPALRSIASQLMGGSSS